MIKITADKDYAFFFQFTQKHDKKLKAPFQKNFNTKDYCWLTLLLLL